MKAEVSRRIVSGGAGLLYGVVLAAVGMLSSGGGHSNLLTMLALAPYGFGFLIWPALGIILVDLASTISKMFLLLFVLIHYGGFILYVYQNWEDELNWLSTAINYPSFVVPSVLGAALYISGQVFLWSSFFRHYSTRTAAE